MEKSRAFSQIRAYASQKNLPIIPIKADKVTILTEPSSFYKQLLTNVQSCVNRLALSALYLGTGPKERALVESICDTMNKKPDLNVSLAFDANRATREEHLGQSSVSLLNCVLTSENVKFYLINPSRNGRSILTRLLSHFQKLNEVISTFHSKLMIFDDDVIVTGANLSSIYFEKRQDRYMVFEDSKLLADYLFRLIGTVGEREDSLKGALDSLNSSFMEENSRPSFNNDSYIIPLVQSGYTSLTAKEDFLKFLNSITTHKTRTYLSTGYFNPSSVVDSVRIDDILAPSEVANGFYAGKGLLKYVPRLYSAIQKEYLDRHRETRLHLYSKPGWSFHAKGIWIEGFDDLYIHMIGSSNFNRRSSERDFETELVILTKNKALIEKLVNERVAIWRDSSRIESHSLKGLNPIYWALSKILRKFL